ncbi:RDD family protein [Microlunatus speluncae]|uniref:RDD family protein n=1 Tax=Microlunatus speluncae TaxID=2594267 RepID=UPI001376235D|nr:RDD family protein [Microlunatus speluncae]
MSQPDDPGQQSERGVPGPNRDPGPHHPVTPTDPAQSPWSRPDADASQAPHQPSPEQQWQAPGPDRQPPPQQPAQPFQQPAQSHQQHPQQQQPDQSYQQHPQQQYQPPQGPGPQPGQQHAPYGGAPYPPAQQPMPGPPMPYPPAAVPRTDYASWGKRVGANLIDFIPAYIVSIVAMIWYFGFIGSMITALQRGEDNYVPDLTSMSVWMIVLCVLSLLSLGWNIYNRWLTGGRTGQSLGKRVTKIKLISEQTGQPIGAGNAFLRDIVHYLDGIAYVGYLWPLWDEKRQTFSDKLMRTIVIDQPDQRTAV